MRSYTTVYRADGSPIEVVTVENEKSAAMPLTVAGTNKVEERKLVENKALAFGPSIAASEPDR